MPLPENNILFYWTALERVLLFLRPQGALYYPPHCVGDAGKGDTLFWSSTL